MSAIERFLAAILLTAAVGGTAAVAHHVVGTPPSESEPIRLTEPQRQHASAPGVVWAPVRTPIRPLERPAPSLQTAVLVAPTRARTSAPAVVTSRPVVVPRVTKPRSVAPPPTPVPPAPVPAPVAPPATPPVAAPTQVPDPPRVLASVPEPKPVPAPPQDVPIVPTPCQGDDEPAHGNGHGDGNGNGNGNANGNGNGNDSSQAGSPGQDEGHVGDEGHGQDEGHVGDEGHGQDNGHGHGHGGDD
jgi:hypothetical protein